VVGIDTGPDGGTLGVRVQCSCGAPPHRVEGSNLRRGKSTRCNACAKVQSARWRKNYYAYADVVPDTEHRRRLLNRISACLNRCHNPRDRGYRNYGGRGIYVHKPWRSSRREFLRYLVTLEGWDQPDLELDRINVDRGYEPGNLRFITRTENAGNRRKVQTLQQRIAELEARLRHYERGASVPLHDPFD
jgi:hypothetical protein